MSLAQVTITDALRDPPALETVIDVRSPSEFAEDHLPGAVNWPVLDDAERAEEEDMAEELDPVTEALGQVRIHDVDLDVLALEQRIAGAQQEDRAEQIPLQLQPAVRTDVERKADDGIDRGDENGRQDQPAQGLAEPLLDGIDRAADAQKKIHPAPLVPVATG